MEICFWYYSSYPFSSNGQGLQIKETKEGEAEDIMQSFKTLVGGELTAYNGMMNEARQ